MFRDLPSRHSIRIPDFDYSSPNWYYVTICTYKRECMLGDVIDGIMVLNDIGKMIQDHWERLSIKFPSLELDEHIIMPNHVHGIIILNKGREDPAPTLGQIIAYFKYQTTKQYNCVGAGSSRPCDNYNHLWQRNYWEHIIRDEGELVHVRKYILDNPINWAQDKLFV